MYLYVVFIMQDFPEVNPLLTELALYYGTTLISLGIIGDQFTAIPRDMVSTDEKKIRVKDN